MAADGANDKSIVSSFAHDASATKKEKKETLPWNAEDSMVLDDNEMHRKPVKVADLFNSSEQRWNNV